MSHQMAQLVAENCLVVLLVTFTAVVIGWAVGFIRFLWRDA